METVRKALLNTLPKILALALDFVFGLFGMRHLRAILVKLAFFNLFIPWCLHILRSGELGYRDNADVGCGLLASASFTITVVLKAQVENQEHAIFRLYRHTEDYGILRVLIYTLSVIVTAFVVVFLAINVTTRICNAISGEVLGRLDDNVIRVNEDRNYFKNATIHPSTKGENRPYLLYSFYRYTQEDVEMVCDFTDIWLSGARPSEKYVIWRRNGVPIAVTDRLRHRVSFEEASESEHNLGFDLKEEGLIIYNVKATLTIYLLSQSEFGTYTCHASDRNMKSSWVYIVSTLDKMNFFRKNKADEDKKPGANEDSTKKKRVFEDDFSLKGEFRLVELSQRQETFRAPASSILEFTTSYWHLSASDDIEIDYTVNEQSYYELCPGDLHGCSKFLLLYWYFGHKTGGRFGAPPLQLFTIWEVAQYPAERFILVHCLCENAYGYHNIKYLRRYYNITSQRYQLIEIDHPKTLVVVPREQKMHHLFVNRSECSPVIDPDVCQGAPSVCTSGFDMRTLRDFAEAVVAYFNWVEIALILILIFLFGYAVRNTNLFLAFLGRKIKLFTLEGSMAFWSTARITGEARHGDNPPNAEVEKRFDIFLSYSEDDARRVHEHVLPYLEGQGQKVCVKERDLPPNLPEVSAIATALEHSDRFVLFLTPSFLDDPFENFEAPMIMDIVRERPDGTDAVLVVKLDPCDVPLWMARLRVHDWTSACRSLQDNLLRLLKWLEPRERRGTVRCKRDAFLTCLPFLVAISVGVLGCLILVF